MYSDNADSSPFTGSDLTSTILVDFTGTPSSGQLAALVSDLETYGPVDDIASFHTLYTANEGLLGVPGIRSGSWTSPTSPLRLAASRTYSRLITASTWVTVDNASRCRNLKSWPDGPGHGGPVAAAATSQNKSPEPRYLAPEDA